MKLSTLPFSGLLSCSVSISNVRPTTSGLWSRQAGAVVNPTVAGSADCECSHFCPSAMNTNPCFSHHERTLGNLVSSEGQFLVSDAMKSDATRACVLNGGQISGVARVTSNFLFYYPANSFTGVSV